MRTAFSGEPNYHVLYYTGMDPCALCFLPPVKTDFAWGDNRSSLLKYSTRYYVPRWSNSACQMGSDRIGPGQRACRKTLLRPHVEQITVEKVLSLRRCCPCTLTRGVSPRLSTPGLFYQTKIYCAPNLQKRWRALWSALSLAVMPQTKAWKLGPF